LIIGELALVLFLIPRIQGLQASTATLLFINYAVLNGLILSFVFLLISAHRLPRPSLFVQQRF